MRTKKTFLSVRNETNVDIIKTVVREIDNYDWDTNSGPHRNFNNATIKSMQTRGKREEVNKSASNCPFTMALQFRDGTEDIFRINQKYAIDDAAANFQHKKKMHEISYWRGHDNDTLYIVVKNTQAQKEEILAEKIRKDASAKLQQKRYEEALRDLDQALRHANQTTTKNNIITQQADIYYQYGLSLMNEGFDLEAKNRAQDAEKKFNDAKTKLQKAESLRHNANYQQNIKIVTLKMEANKIFNDALNQEKEAYDLFTNARKSGVFNDYTESQNKYKEVAVKYEECLKKFEEGAKTNAKFGDCVKIVKEQIAAVAEVVDNIDKVELNHNINQIHVNDDKEEDREESEQVNKTLLEQRDGDA